MGHFRKHGLNDVNDHIFTAFTANKLIRANSAGTNIESSELSVTDIFNLSGSTVVGTSYFNALSATTVSGGTIYSGSTNVESLFATQALTTSLQSQINTKANRSGDTFTGNVFAPGLSASTLSGGTVYSGSTNLESIFATQALTTNLQSQINTKANLSGATFTGTVNAPALSATTLSGGTIYSGSTDLSTMFGSITTGLNTKYDKSGGTISGNVDITGNIYIQGNLEVLGSATTLSSTTIQTGDNNIVLNFSGTHLSAIGGGITVVSGQTNGSPSTWLTDSDGTWLSNTKIYSPEFSGSTGIFAGLTGGTIFSGSTNLEAIFATLALTTNLQTQINTKANLSGATFTGNVFAPGLSASTLSGGTIYSGSTDIGTIFTTAGQLTRVQPGLNTYTGGTATFPTVNISAATLDNLTVSGATVLGTLNATTVSGGTIYSGSTNLESIFATQTLTTSLQAQINTKANRSGDTFTGTVNAPTLSATTVSAGTIYSGSTNLYSIFQTIGSDTAHTYVQPGLNTYTGGTAALPTVNVSAATLATLSVSGASSLNTATATSLSATSLTGTTVYVGTFLQMVPYIVDPSAGAADNDAWFFSASTGIITLNYKVGGSAKSVELS